MGISTYQLIERARTGDVLICEGLGLIGITIRVLTGGSGSHVALLRHYAERWCVVEMREGIGYQAMPLEDWIAANRGRSRIYYGRAPDAVRRQPVRLDSAIEDISRRPPPYSYWSLAAVWLAQILRRRLLTHRLTRTALVCSTFVQRIWERAGFDFEQTADPSDYFRLCEHTAAIDPDA